MISLRLFFVFCFLTLVSAQQIAQVQEDIVFPPDQNGFISQVEAFLHRSPDKLRKETILEFNNWVANYQPEENEWIELAETSNELLKKGIKPYPQFLGFLKAIISFQNDKLDDRAFSNCLSFMKNSLKSDSKNIIFAENLWKFVEGYNNKNELHSSGAVTWTFSTSNSKLEVDSSMFLSFQSGTLKGIAGREESIIECSKARYYPIKKILKVEQGSTNWESVDLSPDMVYVQMQDFSLDLSKSVYSIDSARLFDQRYFDYPILGQLENKIATGLPKERRAYPRFTSYNTMNQIKDIYGGTDYQGGYSLQGSKIIGANILNKKGYLTFFFEGIPKLRVSSDYFVLTPDRATGVNAEISIYINADSIFHPGLSFRYNDKTLESTMIRDGQGLSNSRFFNTYHQLDLNVEMISWIKTDSLMTLSGMFGSLKSLADFESSDFYSIERFNEVQVADLVNPLIIIKNCSLYYGSRFFTTSDLSKYMDRPYHLIEELLLNLSFLGFVRYDTEQKMIEVNQRCFDFISKHAKRQDYDMIYFRSDQAPPNPNGFLNLRTGQLELFGVNTINFSSVRKVSAFPINNTIKIDQNRAISFDGVLKSGLVQFYGTGFSLDYDPFELKMDHIDKIMLKVHLPVNNNYENTITVDISSIIENTSGSLFIDHPENKSGINEADLPDFPLFVADTTAYVYYDQNFIQNGAYLRDSFYFSTENLILKGLNSKYLKDSLSIGGQFVTAGIFPEINVDLRYQEDHSLGFDTLYTPESGYPVYGQRGIFYNQINMNSEGLLGNGTLEYMGATMISENFLFLPDEVRSRVTTIDIAQDIVEAGSPQASGNEVNISWKPNEDKMVANQEEGLMNLYEGVAFDGDVYIEPDGLKGNGIMRFSGYKIESADFHFFQNSLQANDAEFIILSNFQEDSTKEDAESIDFRVAESLVHVDFRDSSAHIESQSESSSAQFPELKFTSKFENIDWIIGSNIIDIAQPGMISTKPEQKGLSFEGKNAKYDLNAYELEVKGVDFIDIADVRIFPGSNSASIRMNGFIDSLPNSTIVPQDTSLQHIITESVVYLRSSIDYRANGNYKYIDRADRESNIKFNSISVNSNQTTTAKGRVEIFDNFFLSPEYAFQGTVSLNMKQKLLNFDGHFQLTHDCASTTKKWISLTTDLDPLKLILPFDSLSTDINGDKAYAGYFLSNQPIEFYSTFMGPHTRYSDSPALEASGFVQFNDETGEYRLTSSDKLKNPELVLPELKLDRENCQVVAEGIFSPSIDLGQITLKSAGKITHFLNTDAIDLQTVTSLDFFMNDRAMSFMAKELNKFTQAQAVNYSDNQIRRSLQYFLGSERASEILSELSLRGSFKKLPDDLKHSIFFSKLDLKWNSERGSFQSIGKIGISNISDTPINKLFTGNIEISHRRGGGTFTMYIETEPGSYFFFYYNRGLMQVMAGPKYEKFNDLVKDTKESKRKLAIESGSEYQYYIGQYRIVRNFLDQINEQ